MNRKNEINNIATSVLNTAVSIINIFIPYLLIRGIGSDSNGAIGTINQVFSCFTIFEAGIGLTTLQALYSPVAHDDKARMNAILSATSRYYRKVAFLYFSALVTFAFIYGMFKNGEYGHLYLMGTVMFMGLGSVFNFMAQEKYKILLDVTGKKYITVNTLTVIGFVTAIVKIVLLLMGFNILALGVGTFVINFIQVFVISLYTKKHYKWIDLSVEPAYDAIAQKNSVFVHQISSLIFSSTDVIILNMFYDSSVASIYVVYKMVITVISSFMYNISAGLTFRLGQTYSTDIEEYKKQINVYDILYQALGFALFTITLIFLIPFMKIYAKDKSGVDYIIWYLPYMFVAIELLIIARNAQLNTINIAGHFRSTKWRAALEATINLSVSLLLVRWLGMAGVLMGTIIALLYRTNDVIIYGNRTVLKRSPLKTYGIVFYNVVLCAFFKFVFTVIPLRTDNFLWLVLSAVIVTIIVLPSFFGVALLINKKERGYIIAFAKDAISSRLKKGK